MLVTVIVGIVTYFVCKLIYNYVNIVIIAKAIMAVGEKAARKITGKLGNTGKTNNKGVKR